MATELMLARHGETAANSALRFQGHIDEPLNAIGVQQAHRLGVSLTENPPHIVVSSDLSRATQTAAVICSHLRVPYSVTSSLRGQNLGIFEGRTRLNIETLYPEMWRDWLMFREDYSVPGGESKRDLFERSINAVLDVAKKHRGQKVLLVTHGDVLDMIWRYCHSLALDGVRQCPIPNGGINSVVLDEVDGRARVVKWADIDHLAGMPSQPTYDQSHYRTGSSSSKAQ